MPVSARHEARRRTGYESYNPRYLFRCGQALHRIALHHFRVGVGFLMRDLSSETQPHEIDLRAPPGLLAQRSKMGLHRHLANTQSLGDGCDCFAFDQKCQHTATQHALPRRRLCQGQCSRVHVLDAQIGAQHPARLHRR